MPAPSTKATLFAPMDWCSRRRRLTMNSKLSGPITVRLWIASDAPRSRHRLHRETGSMSKAMPQASRNARIIAQRSKGSNAGNVERTEGALALMLKLILGLDYSPRRAPGERPTRCPFP
jgi:hypothetical protein